MKPDQISTVKNKLIPMIIALIAGSTLSLFLSCWYFRSAAVRDISGFLKTVAKIERGYIENLPLYEDFSTPRLEIKLRTHLFADHMRIAKASGIGPLERDDEIGSHVDSGSLIRLPSGKDVPYFFYNVREEYRVLTPDTARGLDLLAGRFRENIESRASLPQVKIAVSSALRTASYQNGLRNANDNATPVTTHSYGVSFDIFYDDYYVLMPQPVSSNRISGAILEMLRIRMGFMLGDALRGQFRSVLAESLDQLQDEGTLYAILEKRQRCYHVTVLPKAKRAGKID